MSRRLPHLRCKQPNLKTVPRVQAKPPAETMLQHPRAEKHARMGIAQEPTAPAHHEQKNKSHDAMPQAREKIGTVHHARSAVKKAQNGAARPLSRATLASIPKGRPKAAAHATMAIIIDT